MWLLRVKCLSQNVLLDNKICKKKSVGVFYFLFRTVITTYKWNNKMTGNYDYGHSILMKDEWRNIKLLLQVQPILLLEVTPYFVLLTRELTLELKELNTSNKSATHASILISVHRQST